LKYEMIWKIWKKGKLNSEKMWKIWKKVGWMVKWHGKYGKKSQVKCEMIWKLWKKSKLNSDKIWKIQKKIVKRFGKYRRK
jgi:hypothetical protein